ncbi:hypothetical protein D9M70_476370 [compost metagenome]
MESVDVLQRIDRLQHVGFIDMRRQRQLHEDAVHTAVGIEAADKCQQVSFDSVCRQLVFKGTDAAFLSTQHLVAHVDLARRILADQHYRQGRGNAACFHFAYFLGHFGQHAGSGRFAVDQLDRGLSVHRKITVRSPLRKTRCSRWYFTALDRATVSVSRPMATRSSGR